MYTKPHTDARHVAIWFCWWAVRRFLRDWTPGISSLSFALNRRLEQLLVSDVQKKRRAELVVLLTKPQCLRAAIPTTVSLLLVRMRLAHAVGAAPPHADGIHRTGHDYLL